MPYPIRSGHTSLFRICTLLFSALVLFAILYLVILHYLGNGFLTLLLLLGGLIVALFEALLFHRTPRWLAFVVNDAGEPRLPQPSASPGVVTWPAAGCYHPGSPIKLIS